jgi:hypothetical protein
MTGFGNFFQLRRFLALHFHSTITHPVIVATTRPSQPPFGKELHERRRGPFTSISTGRLIVRDSRTLRGSKSLTTKDTKVHEGKRIKEKR